MKTEIKLSLTQLIETSYPGLNVMVKIFARVELSHNIDGKEYADPEIVELRAISAEFETGATDFKLPLFNPDSLNREQQMFMGMVREQARKIFHAKTSQK